MLTIYAMVVLVRSSGLLIQFKKEKWGDVEDWEKEEENLDVLFRAIVCISLGFFVHGN